VRAGFGRVTAFAPSLDGEVYAQPLYLPGLTIGGARHDVLFVATQNNSLYALDAVTGAALWRTALGAPVPRSMQQCGNINTIGVVSTGVIDPATGTLYAVAFTSDGSLRFRLNALDVTTGRQRARYPADITPPAMGGSSFDARATGQRGALQFDAGRVYVPFGGLYGDCGIYHGWVVGLDAADPTRQVAFATPGRGSGIWAPAGSSMDETGRLYVATGNSTPLGGTTPGSMGERVIRLGGGPSGPTGPTGTAAYFEASDARLLDLQDLDIGSVAPVLLPPIAGAPRMLWQGGKAGVSYLVDRENLGGAVGPIFQARYFSGGNFGAAATWSNGTQTYVFAPGRGTRSNCAGSGGVMALRVNGSALETAWCSATVSNPSPPAVSSNGNASGLLWVAGTSPATLRAIEIATGMEVFADAPPSVRQWTPIVVADGRVYVTGASSVSLYTTR
jgi:outer membrane protein assembly factor BamB